MAEADLKVEKVRLALEARKATEAKRRAVEQARSEFLTSIIVAFLTVQLSPNPAIAGQNGDGRRSNLAFRLPGKIRRVPLIAPPYRPNGGQTP